MEKKPVIAVYHNLPSGGAKRALYEFCRILTGWGYAVDAFVPASAKEAYLPLDPVVRKKTVFAVRKLEPPKVFIYGLRGYLNVFLETLNLLFFEGRQKEIARQIDEGGYDVVFVDHCFMTQAPSILRFLKTPSLYFCQEPIRSAYEAPIRDEIAYEKGLISPFERFLNESPLNPYRFIRWLRKKRDRRNALSATLLAANSQFTHEVNLRTYGLNSFVLRLGVDAEKFKPLNLPRENRVLSVGGFHKVKGFRFLIRSLACIEEKDRPDLVIIGDRGESKEKEILEKLAREKKVRTTLLEGLDDSELVEQYNRAALVVYVPYLEPFGFVPLEAMACGTPVVGVSEGGVRESVADGRTGLLVERDPEALAAAVIGLLNDEPRRIELGRNGVEDARKNWTWEKSTENLLRLLRKTMEEASSR